MPLNILGIFGELSDAADKFIEESENLRLEQWFSYAKKKALDIQRSVQPTSSTAIPNCLTFVKGSSREKFCTRVSSVLQFMGKDHLHGRHSTRSNTYDQVQILDYNHTYILPETAKIRRTSSSADKTYTAYKDLELNRTVRNYSVDEVFKNSISEIKQDKDGSSLSAEQELSKPLPAANFGIGSLVQLDHEPNEIVMPKEIKVLGEAVSTDKTFVVEKEEVADVKKTTTVKQNKRKQDEISKGTAKHEKQQVRSLSYKKKKVHENDQAKSLSYKRKNLDNPVKDLVKISKLKTCMSFRSKQTTFEKKGKATYSPPKKVNASSKSKHLKSVLQSKENHSFKGAPSLIKSVSTLSPKKKNIISTMETNDRVECSKLNETFVSTVKETGSDEVATPLTTNNHRRTISIQTDAAYCTPMVSGSASEKYKVPSIPTALTETKLASITLSETGRNTSEQSSSASIRSCEDTTDRTSAVSYDISEIQDSDDDETEKQRVKKHIPSWAKGVALKNALCHQHYHPMNTDALFGRICPAVDLEAMFGIHKKRYFKRTSSAIWSSPSSFTKEA